MDRKEIIRELRKMMKKMQEYKIKTKNYKCSIRVGAKVEEKGKKGIKKVEQRDKGTYITGDRSNISHMC